MSQINTITIDGKEYPLTDFSQQVQTLVGIHSKWSSELQEQRLDVAKTEAALRNLDAELSKLVASEIQAQAAPAADAEAAAE